MSQKFCVLILSLCLPLAACQVKPGGSSVPVKLSASEVKTLFVGKTVESYSLSSGATSFTYYDPNGAAKQHRFWGFREGQWSINAEGEMCLSMEEKPLQCRPVYLQGDRYYKLRPDGKGNLEKIVRYRQFIEGDQL